MRTRKNQLTELSDMLAKYPPQFTVTLENAGAGTYHHNVEQTLQATSAAASVRPLILQVGFGQHTTARKPELLLVPLSPNVPTRESRFIPLTFWPPPPKFSVLPSP